jgi:hypothetical protein
MKESEARGLAMWVQSAGPHKLRCPTMPHSLPTLNAPVTIELVLTFGLCILLRVCQSNTFFRPPFATIFVVNVYYLHYMFRLKMIIYYIIYICYIYMIWYIYIYDKILYNIYIIYYNFKL